ncbi:hypothetical protein BGX34_007358 [Mortierella sp. NVP85]|nr:hypothetical protein BGX34_007358 [Mortierella sp. NVP85]
MFIMTLGKHVVFGRVVKGYDVVEQVENTPTDERNDRPLGIVMISNCGELELRIPPKVLEQQKLQQAAVSSSKADQNDTKKSTSKAYSNTRDDSYRGSDAREANTKDVPNERQRETVRSGPRARSRSPEVKYKGRGAMKYREKRPRW